MSGDTPPKPALAEKKGWLQQRLTIIESLTPKVLKSLKTKEKRRASG